MENKAQSIITPNVIISAVLFFASVYFVIIGFSNFFGSVHDGPAFALLGFVPASIGLIISSILVVRSKVYILIKLIPIILLIVIIYFSVIGWINLLPYIT